MPESNDGTVVVVGAGSAAGRAVCAALVEAGHRVAAVDLREPDVPGTSSHAVDATDHAAVDALAAEVRASGPVAGLVHLIGGWRGGKGFTDNTDDDWRFLSAMLLDTPGAYPGIDAEERGQAEAIAVNLREMARLESPLIAVVIGEGGSGGALGLGVGNQVYMMQNSVYSVITPESCAAIIYRDSAKAPDAAAALKMTAPDMLRLGLVDKIVDEPTGGAQEDYDLAAKELGMLVAGGGHAMAAGLTIDATRIAEFAAFLDERLAANVARAREDRALLVDALLAPGGVTPDLCETMEAGGPYGMGWPAPRVAAGPFRIVRVDVVGNGHVRAIVSGDDGRSLKAMAFRAADTPLGQTLLQAPRDRKLWLAGRPKVDDWASRPAAELHLDDAAWAD